MSAACAVFACWPEAQTVAWYAIFTQVAREKTARSQLRTAAIEVFWPYYLRRTQWGRRGDVVRVETPLFPGYLFARFDCERDISTVRNVPGVSQVVGPGAKPTAIDDDVIATIRRACSNPALVSPAEYPFAAGERVTVASGPFAGLTGVVERTKGRRRLVVLIEVLNRACAVELGQAEVFPAGR